MAKKKVPQPPKDQKTEQGEINAVAKQIGEILASHGMEMQAVIQILKHTKSPIQMKSPEQMAKDAGIILAGGEGDIPPGLMDALRPNGDRIDS